MSRRKGRRLILAWGLLFVVALALRVAGLGSQSLWIDEAFSINAARLDRPLLWGDLVVNLHGPLHAVVLHNWAKLFGNSEASLRWPSVIASLLALPALWFLVRRLIGEKAAWVGVVVLALSPMSIWYAQEVRNYSMLLLFSTLAFLTWLRLLEKPRSTVRVLVHALSLFLGFLSNLAALFLIPVQVFWLLGRKRRQWAATAAVWVLLAILLLPWEIRFYENRVVESGVLGHETPSLKVEAPKMRSTFWGVPFAMQTFAGGPSLGPSFRSLHIDRMQAIKRSLPTIIPAAVVFGGLVLWGLLGPAVPSRRTRLNLLVWLLVPPLAVWLLAVINLKESNPRYALVAFPAFVALLAAGWIGLPSWRTRVVAGLLILAMWGLALGRVHADPEYRKAEFREASLWLRDHVGPQTLWVTFGIDTPLRVYYLSDLFDGKRILQGEYRRMGWYWAALPDEFWGDLETLIPDYSEVLFVECRAFHLNHEKDLERFMSEHCMGSPTEKRWGGVRVLWCETPGRTQVRGDG